MQTWYSRMIMITLAVFLAPNLFAQQSGVRVTGKVLDRQSQQPIEFATVMIADPQTKKPLTGATTGADGNFELEAQAQQFYVEISFIGFVTQTFEDLTAENGKVDLGTILLSDNSQVLDEVVVRAEKSTTEFKLDKRVFNVGKDLSSTGASVLEVLNNVPSVNVNIEGEISLRGSTGVQILINGKPSVLANEGGNALGTITAEMIEKIEVITNPSAKYDAEGTSGIINIVLKKEERKGLNGSFTLNTGTPHNHSFGLSLNRRTDKFNLFSQVGVGYREFPADVEQSNRDLVNNTAVEMDGRQQKFENFYNLILGTDYHINKRNILTLSGFFAYEIEDEPSLNNFSLFDANNNEVSRWTREETTEATNPKFQYELQYKRDFKDNKDHTLLFSALGNFFGKDQSSEFVNTTTLGNDADGTQQTRTDFKEARYTFKLDYTKPYSEKWTVETGAQYVIQDVSNDFEVNDLVDGIWINDIGLTNIFDYNQNVLGAYVTGAYEGDAWGLKLGLRVENTDLKTLLLNTDETNNQNFTNLFPTLHTSYKLTENLSVQAGYSRRIYRPRMWDLNPFFNIRNNFSIRTGNPQLLPEFTDSYEVAGIYIIGKTSLNFGIYHRYTTEVIERISTFENNVNIFKPINIGTNRATGLEFNAKYSPKNWWTINGDLNYNYFSREGDLEAVSFDFNADQWWAKVTNKFQLPADLDIEVTGHYQSKFQTVQSEISGNIFADLGMRKTIMKGRGVLNLSIRDVFASRIRESITSQPTFFLYSWSQRGRFVSFGFSYGFGKGEAMEVCCGEASWRRWRQKAIGSLPKKDYVHSMNKFDRVFSTLILLQTRKVIKAKAISERFGISLRTVYRDISTLKNAGIPIIGDPGIGYSIVDGYRLPPVMFNEGEAAALLTAEKFIGRVTDKETQAYYSQAMIKIKAILRSSEKQVLEVLDNAIAITNRSSWENKAYLQDLFRSLASRRIIEIEYQKIDGARSERKLEPIGCYLHVNNWYLVAFCQLKKAYRTFKVNRIVSLRVLDHEYDNRHISLQKYIEQQDESWKNEHQFHTIEIAFNPSLLKYAESRKYYFGFISQTRVNEVVHMTFLNSSLELFARWLLQFGDQASVITPSALNDRLKVLAAQLYQHYQ